MDVLYKLSQHENFAFGLTILALYILASFIIVFILAMKERKRLELEARKKRESINQHCNTQAGGRFKGSSTDPTKNCCEEEKVVEFQKKPINKEIQKEEIKKLPPLIKEHNESDAEAVTENSNRSISSLEKITHEEDKTKNVKFQPESKELGAEQETVKRKPVSPSIEEAPLSAIQILIDVDIPSKSSLAPEARPQFSVKPIPEEKPEDHIQVFQDSNFTSLSPLVPEERPSMIHKHTFPTQSAKEPVSSPVKNDEEENKHVLKLKSQDNLVTSVYVAGKENPKEEDKVKLEGQEMESQESLLESSVMTDLEDEFAEFRTKLESGKMNWTKTHFIFVINSNGSINEEQWNIMKQGMIHCIVQLGEMKSIVVSGLATTKGSKTFCEEEDPKKAIEAFESAKFIKKKASFERASELIEKLLNGKTDVDYLSCILYATFGNNKLPELITSKIKALKEKGRKCIFYTLNYDKVETESKVSMTNVLSELKTEITFNEDGKHIFAKTIDI